MRQWSAIWPSTKSNTPPRLRDSGKMEWMHWPPDAGWPVAWAFQAALVPRARGAALLPEAPSWTVSRRRNFRPFAPMKIKWPSARRPWSAAQPMPPAPMQRRNSRSDQENAGARVILARNMNDQQVQDLAACLSQPERNLYATVHLDRSDAYRGTGLATLARLDDKDQKQHSLAYERSVQENEVMLREKVVAANAPPVAPTTRPAEPF